jgi:hypothetical protein
MCDTRLFKRQTEFKEGGKSHSSLREFLFSLGEDGSYSKNQFLNVSQCLFDEIYSLKAFITKEKIKERDMNNANTCARWSEVFLHFSEKMVHYLQLQCLVEIYLCLPGSIACVERVFSAMNMIWTSQQ